MKHIKRVSVARATTNEGGVFSNVGFIVWLISTIRIGNSFK